MQNKNRLLIIGGLIVAIFIISCLCCVGVSLMSDDGETNVSSKPTETRVMKNLDATSTPEVAETPAPTNTPVPVDTPTPAPSLSFADVVQHPDEKGWTGTQYKTYFDTIIGQSVSGWTGTILEIKEYAGEPYLSLDMEPGEPKIDAYVYIDENDVLRVGLGQNVTFAGTIDSNWSEGNGFYSVQVKKVTLQDLGEIPPTPTPGPTNTPTPDIGSDTMAGIMCENFVEERLKSPSTAEFGSMWDDEHTKSVFVTKENAESLGVDTSTITTSGLWVSEGVVDSQNSFGAMIRAEFICVMTYDPSTEIWQLFDISIE